VARPDERIVAVADIIERYVKEHPRAADTPAGIRTWWIERRGRPVSSAVVQQALDLLVAQGRLARTVLADGTVIYGRAPPTTRRSGDH
jgi:hypothetical protein